MIHAPEVGSPVVFLKPDGKTTVACKVDAVFPNGVYDLSEPENRSGNEPVPGAQYKQVREGTKAGEFTWPARAAMKDQREKRIRKMVEQEEQAAQPV